MSVKLGIYKCSICGNIVQVLINGDGELICCGKEMELLSAHVSDAGEEKHVPVINKHDENFYSIKVGSQPHPMTDEHYIMFVEALSSDRNKIYLEYLNPGVEPEISAHIAVDKAFEYCNIHGLWEGKFND